MENRESFKSRLGFILVSAGCAIGIGNVWRFPYVTGQNGGGIFVLFYLLFLLIMGVPVLTMELAVGRASKKSIMPAYQALQKPGQKWHYHGWLAVAGNYILMMYYTTVSGWMICYFFKFLTGSFKSGMDTEAVNGVFGAMLGNPAEMTFWMVVTVVGGFLVCSFGLQNGIEKITKWMMLALLALIVILAGHSLLLEGGGEGVAFYLLPDLEKAKAVGIGNVITAAMNQSFFTLSLGIASMEIFGSYMKKDHTLGSEAVRICALDTFVAFMAGMIIFPACFAFGVEPDAGPPLIFQTLPNVFINMAGGRVWGTLFFLFMTFASFSTVIAVFENILASVCDIWEISRKKSAIINGIILLVTSMPCVLGYNVWSNLRLIGGRDVLDSEDFIVSNLLLPIGCLIFLLFCTTKWGWGFDNYMEEANTGSGIKLPKQLKYYFKYILPVLILVILITGLI
ncbi:MAG: sodium-dependent transporter [Lachnospiraceae bacterium]|nr:sodium-dependent transporter [Lachnospiraceae bacterium]